MATQFDAVPDVQFDAIPEAVEFDAVPDDVTVQEAQRATIGAVQALDVMGAPSKLDWSDVNEQMDTERFREAEGARATGQNVRAAELIAAISPLTTAGKYLAGQRDATALATTQAAETAARGSTPSSLLSGFMGTGLTGTVQPVIESAGRNLGAAAGGAIGAAAFIPGPPAAASRLATMAATVFPIGAAVMGSLTGTEGQEALLRTTETPVETEQRQERAAEDFAANPGLSRIGAAAAGLPFFRPGLAQFGRAVAGDRGAQLNLGIAGAIGGAMEVGTAMVQGRTVDAADVAAGVFSNLIMNEPTRLGRRLGLHPSAEQEAAEAGPVRKPLGEVPSDLATDVMPSERDVFAGVQRKAQSDADQAWLRGEEFDAVPEAPAAETASIPIQSSEAPSSLKIAVAQNRLAGNRVKLVDGTFEALNPVGGVDQDGVMTLNGFVDESIVTELQDASGKVLWSKPLPAPDFQAVAAKQGLEYDGPLTFQDTVEGQTFSDTTSKPGTRITFNVEGDVTPEAIAAAHAAKLKAFGVKPATPVEASVEPTVPPAAEPPAVPPAEPPPVNPAAAVPEAVPQDSTSNKEAVVNAERAARELDPVIKEARISNADSIDNAQRVITENPLKPSEIVARLRENPQERTISLEDSAVLLVERTRLNKLREELLVRATDESLDSAEQAAAKTGFEAIETRLNELDQAAQDARSTWGRFGQLWQRSMRSDFTLEPMLSRARLKKGEALTPEETATIKTIADDVAAKQAEADAAVEQAEAAAVEKQVDETITTIAKTPDAEPAVRSLADRIIAKLDKQAETARQELRELLKNLNAFVPDPRILTRFTVLAANRIAKSSIKAGQWAAEMVKEFGEKIRPYLDQAYKDADAHLDVMVNAGTGDKKKRVAAKAKILDAGQQQERVSNAIAARVNEGESLDSLGNYIDKLVESFVKGGVRDRNALVAAVKGVLEPLSPGITDRKAGELISGYGKATLLSKDPLKVVKRDLKGQLQQVSKLEALAAKEPLAKTGPERRTPSDEERRLIKAVNEQKKLAGVVVTDPETQLKSTMDSARTRLGNEIKDLTFEIETGTRPPTRTPVEYAQDIEILRGIRDRLRQTQRDLEGPKQITDEQRIVLTQRALNDSIAALEARIAGQQPATKRAAPDTPEIRALKAKRDALREELNEINSADSLLRENRKAEALVRSIERAEAELAGATQPGKTQGPESQLVAEAREQLAQVRQAVQVQRDADPRVQQERMDAAEAAVEKAIKKLDEQLAAGDITVARSPSPAASQRLEDLRMQRDAMTRLRTQLRNEARPKPNPLDVAIKTRKAALKRQEADYEARIAKGEFGPRTRKPPLDISGDAAAMDALARVQAVKEKFAKLQKQWELANRTRTEKTIDGIKQGWDAVRNLKLSMDLSAPLQTAFAMLAHPREAGKAIWTGAKVFGQQLTRNSDALARRVEQQIENSPNNKSGAYKEMGLDLSLGGKREENTASLLERFADLESRWAGVPDIMKGLLGMRGQQLVKGVGQLAKALPKLVGLGIKASNAGFNAIANHMRARTADAVLARWARRRGGINKEQMQLLGNMINAATGKGGLRGEEGIRALLFAPNYYLSILKQLTFQPAIKAGIRHQGGAAREILEEYVRAAATMTSILTLQYLFGNRDKQTLDPRDQNFGRAMTDKGTSMDFTMGRGAYATLGAQLITGEKINRKGRVEKQDRSSAFLNFLKGRLSREISAGLTTAAGNDFKGKPLDAAGLAKELVAPLSWQDVDQVIKREGLTRGAFIQMLNLLGVTHRLAD